jgi:hypothetical protein
MHTLEHFPELSSLPFTLSLNTQLMCCSGASHVLPGEGEACPGGGGVGGVGVAMLDPPPAW